MAEPEKPAATPAEKPAQGLHDFVNIQALNDIMREGNIGYVTPEGKQVFTVNPNFVDEREVALEADRRAEAYYGLARTADFDGNNNLQMDAKEIALFEKLKEPLMASIQERMNGVKVQETKSEPFPEKGQQQASPGTELAQTAAQKPEVQAPSNRR